VVSGCGGGGWLMFGDAEGCVMFWWWRGFGGRVLGLVAL